MGASLSAVIISGVATITLVVFFRYEKKHGVRYAEDTRMRLDRALADILLRAKQRYHEATTQTIRQSVYYIFHKVLTAILRAVQRLEQRVRSVVHSNKNRANRNEHVFSPHFSAIADHKRETRLSPLEKQHRRDIALLGR